MSAWDEFYDDGRRADGIGNHELYQDRTVQDWHRVTFHRDWWAMDLDLMGACRSCYEPLYLIESTTNPNKATTMLRGLAKRADVPALVIYHRDRRIIRGRQIWPSDMPIPSEPQIRHYLTWLRQSHANTQHARPTP